MMVVKILYFIYLFYPVATFCNHHTKRCIFTPRSKYQRLPEEGMTVPQLIRYFGYPLEIHKVVTEDGYILALHRIPYGRNATAKQLAAGKQRPPVFLQHGLAASASCWVANLPEQSLAFILADSGYDVWLGNVRGNRYSKKHVNISNKDKRFWDFTWQQMSEYDLPAMIDHVLNITQYEQVPYIGHSQGTLVAIAKLSADKEFAKKIKVFVALAPVATVGHITSPIRYLAPFEWSIRDILDLIGDYSLGRLTWLLDFIKPACDLVPVEELLCENIIFYIAGQESKDMLNRTRIPVYLSNSPEDTSMKNIAHFAQMVNSGKMQKYDYGFFKNFRIYGQFWPPEYHPEHIDVPTIVFWSPKDALADGTDVGMLLSKLKHVRSFRLDIYSHLDFVWALNAKDMIYQKIVNLLREY